MEKLFVFGTGNAMATRCYNTCFAIYDGDEYFMVDAGGGNGILERLQKLNVDITKIHNMFVTHKHNDHILGTVWMVRVIATKMLSGAYEGDFNIYCHEDLVETVMQLSKLTLQDKFTNLFGKRILLYGLKDGDMKKVLNYDITFFDIHSTKAKQFGFTTVLNNGKKLTCMGDEPYNPLCMKYVKGSSWLLSEAFCLYKDREKFKPYEKHHSTVKDSCELGEKLKVDNLVLWHTEDKNIEKRKKLYMEEGRQYYSGNLFVPYDMEVIEL